MSLIGLYVSANFIVNETSWALHSLHCKMRVTALLYSYLLKPDIHMRMRRIELSLKTKGWATLEDFSEGQVVRGCVRRAERFGVFVRIDDSAVTGMCHISEVADERVDDLPAMFKPGQGMCTHSLLPHPCSLCTSTFATPVF